MPFIRPRFKRVAVIFLIFLAFIIFTFWKVSLQEDIFSDFSANGDKLFLHKIREPARTCNSRIPIQKSDINMTMVYEKLNFENLPGGVWKQGWDVTYKMDDWKHQNLEVVILPHSHQDPGWVKTFNEYFEDKVKPALSSTLNFLGKNPSSRFIYAEVSYLDAWWGLLSVSEKTAFTKLVRDGNWEIATGGWVMNDEATVHYGATLSQLTEGQHWLMDNIGFFPNTSWSIDPFGHSTTEAYLLRKSGIKNMLIQRTHYEVKKEFALNKQLEFVWRQPWDTNGEAAIFTHMMPFYSYDVPHTCGPNPAICCQFDFQRISIACPWGTLPVLITSDNVAERANLLADQYRKKASLYNNNGVVFIALGDDFRYTSDAEWDLQFTNYQLLIEYINKNQADFKMHVQFGTLSTYFDLVAKHAGSKVFPTLSGDFFTYADRAHDYWSGYYTSRPLHKALARLIESRVRSADILFSLARHASGAIVSTMEEEMFHKLFGMLTVARRQLALFQHHDGMTGTAKSYVMEDYRQRLMWAWRNSSQVASTSVVFLLGGDQLKMSLASSYSEQQDVGVTAADHIWVEPYELKFPKLDYVTTAYVFNSLSRSRDHILTLELDFSALIPIIRKAVSVLSVVVKCNNGNPVEHQLEPLPGQIHDSKIRSRTAADTFNYRFLLRAGPIKLQPLQIVRVTVELLSKPLKTASISIIKPTLVNIVSPLHSPQMYNMVDTLVKVAPLETDSLIANFDNDTGFLKTLINKRTQEEAHLLEIGFVTYSAKIEREMAGAYIMKPDANPTRIKLKREPAVRISRGEIVEEMTIYNNQLEHTIRLFRSGMPSQLSLEIENVLNISHSDFDNKEFVMVIKTGIANSDRSFFTDSNCFQMTRRVYHDKIPLQGNVYPMACAAYIEDSKHRISILSRQPLGVVAGKRLGEINIFLDRRFMQDDERGLSESMNDNVLTSSVFRVLVEKVWHAPGAQPGLTSEAQFVLRDLLNRANQFVLVDEKIGNVLKSEVNLMSPTGMPCNYELDALKTFYSTSQRYHKLNSSHKSQLGILLHRFAPTCGGTDLCTGLSCIPCTSSDSDKVNVKTVFPNLVVDSGVRSSLTFIPEAKEDQEYLADLIVNPMDLEAFLLTTKP